MAEVLLSSDDLTVLGGPAKISLDVDFGPQGDRGSLIFYGYGKPDNFTPPAAIELKVYDTYVNVSAIDDEYQFVYQYLPSEGGALNWTKVVKLSANMYSYNQIVTFDSNGDSEDIEILLGAFLPSDLIGTYSASDFNVQVNILNENPVSCGVRVEEIPSGSTQVLPIFLSAIEYSSGSWQPITGSKTVHLLITVKNNIS
jgi:hypothetical protein